MDESINEIVRDWLRRADHDLQASRVLAAASTPLLDMAVYHCQQAAEKSIKAWLQSKDDPFPKTHDIGELVDQAAKLRPDFHQFTMAAAILTPYVSAFRYPGGSSEPMPSSHEFDEALLHAQAIHDFVLGLLPAEARV